MNTTFAQQPTGADVVAGSAVISVSPTVMDVNAASARTIINWDQFSIGAGNTANFNLPDANSAILNRVTSVDMPSVINGALNSNGHVHLVNPSGIIVGATGVVNTNAFVASTFDIANSDFLEGGTLTFSGDGSNASVVNNGTINTGTGGAHLIANNIANSGVITSVGGNITLSGGGEVTLSNGVNYVQPSLETLASGISSTAGLIRNTGTIRATGAATRGGEVYLVNPNGRILHDGTIAAEQSSNVSQVDAVADDWQEGYPTVGGRVQLEADEITLTENSSIDASGTHGGGTVLVGGDWQGSGKMTQATSVTMEAGAVIDASATQQGDGGTIVLWSDIHDLNSVTRAFGTLVARAGKLFGTGGQIETSGHIIDVDHANVDAGSINGTGGQWLIDPYNWIIGATNASRINAALDSGTSVTIDTQSATGTNSTANNDGTVDNTSDVLGDIQVNSAITKTVGGEASLTLNAANSIIVNAAISSTSGELNVTLDADNNAGVGDGGGIVILGADITTNGGDLRFGTDRTATISGFSTRIGGDVYVNAGSTLSTGGGDVEVSGETILGATGGLTINTGGGDVTFDSVLNSGNSYSFVTGAAGTGSWDAAAVEAKNGTSGGAAAGDSYLVAISSRLENSIASSVTLDNGAYRGAWIGAYRDRMNIQGNGDTTWHYAGGPDANQPFFTQDGNSSNDSYNNFGSGEPNGTGIGGEYAGQFFGNQALWNDLPGARAYSADMTSVYNVMGYVRETNLAASPLTINAGSGAVTFNGGIGGSKALSTLNVTSSGVTLNGDSLITTGVQNYSSALTVNSSFGLNVDGTTLTTGGTLNFTAADDIAIDASLIVPGAISIQGDVVAISGDVTSTDTGDIYIQSNSTATSALAVTGDIFKTGGDRSTLTLRSDGRATLGDVTASGSTALDTVLWSDYHNTNSGGSSVGGTINTNGGHFWVGGSASDGGSATWNGLTVGDGASEGASTANWNALDLYGDISTNGGDVLIWGGDGFSGGIDGIGLGADHIISAGSGDITLLANDVAGAVLTVDTTGQFTFAPHDNAWSTFGLQLEFDGSISSDIFTGTGDSDWLKINNYSLLSGLTLGKTGNTTSIRVFDPIDIAGPISLLGNNITIDNDLTSRATNANISLVASGSITSTASNPMISTSGGDVLFAANSDGSGGGNIHFSNGLSVTTAGGDITLGGGDASGSGFAQGFGSGSTQVQGVFLGGALTLDTRVNTADDASVGGSIAVRGQSAAVDQVNRYHGVGLMLWEGDRTIKSGTGTVLLHGIGMSQGSASNEYNMGLKIGATENSGNAGTTTIVSANTTSDAIKLIGDQAGTATTGYTYGLEVKEGEFKAHAIADGGGIHIEGAHGDNPSHPYDVAFLYNTNTELLAASGPISLIGRSGGRVQNRDPMTIGAKAGTAVTSSTSDVLIQGDTIQFISNPATINTSGTLTLESVSDSFASAFSWPIANLSTTGTLSGLTLGKVGNTAGISIGSAQNVDGQINIYGGAITVNADLTSTENSGIGVFLSGSSITQAAGVGVTTSGADIEYLATGLSATSGGDRAINLSGTSGSLAVINAAGGDISLDGSFAVSGVSGSSDRAILVDNAEIITSGTGAITIVGDATNNPGTGNVWGLQFNDTLIQTESGAIDITGTGGKASGNSRGLAVDGQEFKLLSESGAITIRDLQPTGLTGNYNGLYLRPQSGTEITVGADGSAVASSTSDITIQSDRINFDTNGASGTTFNTSGDVVVESTAASFSSTANLAGLSISGAPSTLRFGKSGNTTAMTLGQGITTTGTQAFHGPVTLGGDWTFATTNSDITFDGTVNSDGTARSLIVSPGTANAIFNGDVGGVAALSALTVNGTANVNADITTSGAQNWTDSITIGGSGTRTLSASTLTTQAVVGGSSDFALITDDLNLGGNVASTGSITIAPKTAGTDIGVGNISGTFSFDNTDFSRLQDGFSSITIGNSAAGDLVVGGISALTDDLTLRAGSSSDLFVNDSISWSSDDALTLAAGQDIFINRNIDISGSAAGLNLYYGGTDGTTASTSNTDYYIDVANRRHIRFDETTAGLKIGNEAFTLVDSVSALQGMTASGRYALTDDLSLAGTTYTDAFYSATFTGKLDGLGNEVDGLAVTANAGGNYGLFGQLSGASVRHIGVTNIDILGQSTSSAAANDLRIGGIVGNVSGSGTTLLDGVWSTGVIATKQGSEQDVFYAGGIAGGHDSGTLQIVRSFSTVNVSSQGSSSTKLSVGGLLGDTGDSNGISSIGGSAQSLLIDRSYATGSIVEGTHGSYFGSGGLVGVVYGDTATLTDSFSRSNVVGGGSSGGIAGYSLPSTSKTYERLYTTLDRFGNGTNPSQSYKSDTLDAATANGTQLPAGWSSDVWSIGEFPTLKAVGVPASLLYVKVISGTGIYGDLAAPTYQIVDADGNTVTLGSGDYDSLDSVSGTGRYTLGQFTNVGTYNSVSYLSGLGFTGDDANLWALNPFTTAGSYTITPRSITAVLSATGANKVYDGNVNAGSGYSPTWSFTNIVSGDSATLNTGSSFFNDADVLDANLFTINGLSLAGITGSNGSLISDYALANTTATVAANITAKPIVINGLFANDKIYDGNATGSINSSGVSYSGLVSGDSVGLTGLGGTFADKNVAADKDVTVTGTFTGADASNYSTSLPTTLTADITPKAITVSGITSGNRVYDGTTLATVDVSGIVFGGIVSGDTLNASGTTGAFADKNVGTGKTVNLSGTTYGGTDAGNYSFADQASTTANITAKAIAVSGITANNKVYDGVTAATLDASGLTFGGIVSGDNLTASGTAGVFTDKNVANGKTVTFSGTTYGGTDVANYSFTDQASTTANITQKAIIVSGITANDKIYDRTTSATLDLSSVVFGGIVSGDNLSASDTTGSFANKTVGSGKTVSLSGTNYGGTDVGNYSFADQSSTTANITKKALVVSGITAANKVYDGTTSSTLDDSGKVYTGLIAGDNFQMTPFAGSFDTKDVGDGKTVTITSYNVGGLDYSNYDVTLQLTAPADITAKAITLDGFAAANKTYDATTVASITNAGTLSGVISGDTINVLNTGATFADKNAATGKTVTLNGVSLGGTDANNYSVASTATNTADIAVKAITLDDFAAANKIYDATTTASIANAGSLTGVISGDTVSVSNSGATFADKTAATGKTVTLSGLTLSGIDAANYSVASTVTDTANITAKAITLDGFAAGGKVYDALTTATIDNAGSLNGVISGDTVAVSNSGATFADKTAAAGKTVTLNGVALSGIDAANYSVDSTVTDTADITAKAITLDGFAAFDKIYDATTVATIDDFGSLSGVIFGDTVAATNSGATFSDKTAATGKTVTLNGVALSGVDAANYSVASTVTDTANVTAKTITLDGFVAANKVYDRNVVATIVDSGSLSGVISGDTVAATNSGATFADKNATTGKIVTLNGVALSGTDAANYSVASTVTDTASITVKAITLDGFVAGDKVYDRTTAATIDNAGALSGVVNGDTVAAINSGATFADKNVAVGKMVTLNGVSLSGTDAANYSVASTVTDTADITQRQITVSGLAGQDKVYNSRTNAQLDLSGIFTEGIVSSDNIIVGLGSLFSDENVGTDKTINIAGELTGSDAGNYWLSHQATVTADITPAAVVVNGIIADGKVYDGNTTAIVDLSNVTFDGIILGDNLTAAATSGTFDNKNVGSGKTVALSGTTYGGTDVGNYTFTDQTSTTAGVTVRSIIVSNLLANDRIYDGTTVATIDHSGVTFNGMIDDDTLTASGTTGVFDNKNVGTGKSVTLSGTTYGGIDVGNYTFSDQVAGTADISAKAIVVNGITAVDTIYDGTTIATVDLGDIEFSGMVMGDTLTASGTTGTYTDKNVDIGKTVTLTGTTYGGTDVGNYTFTDQASTTADVTAKSVTVSGLAAENRVYDGSTVAIIDHSGVEFVGIVSGDDLTASSTTGTFANKNVGTAKTVVLDGTTYGGTDVGNYSVTEQATTTADVSQKSITVRGILASDKVYDGSTVATVDHGGVTFDGLVSGDKLTAASTIGAFADKNVGSGKVVHLSGTQYSGTDAGNYSFTDQLGTTAGILRLDSVTWIGGTSGDWSDPANWAGSAIPDLANVAAIIIPAGVTPTFDNGVAGPVNIDSLNGGNLQIDSGTLNVANDAFLGDFTQQGGTFNVGGQAVFNRATVNAGTLHVTGDAGHGTLAQNGGTIGVGGNVNLTDFEQQAGTLDIGGGLAVTNSFYQSPLGAIDVSGDVEITHTTGDLTVGNLSGNNVNLHSTNGRVHLGDIDSGGTFDVTAGNGNIDQLLGTRINVTGTSTFNATGDIALTNPGNDFVGSVNVDSNNVAIKDSHGGLILGDVTTAGTFDATSSGGAISQSVGGTLAIDGQAAFTASNAGNPANITLANSNNALGGHVSADGHHVELLDASGGIELHNIVATGDFVSASNDGSVTQTDDGGINVAGTTTVAATSEGTAADVELTNKSNNFSGTVNAAGKTVNIDDEDSRLQFGNVSAGDKDDLLMETARVIVRDTNTRYITEDASSGGGILNVVQRYGQEWMSRLVNWLGGSSSPEQVLTEQDVQSVESEVKIVRRKGTQLDQRSSSTVLQ